MHVSHKDLADWDEDQHPTETELVLVLVVFSVMVVLVLERIGLNSSMMMTHSVSGPHVVLDLTVAAFALVVVVVEVTPLEETATSLGAEAMGRDHSEEVCHCY
jgi:hypothetical protein